MSQDPNNHGHGDASGTRILIAFALNIGITVAQIIGGMLSGSLALLGDAAHNGSDAVSLGIAYGAQRLARRPANRRFTFGYERAKTIGALINLTTLYVIALYLGYQGVRRLLNPPEVEGLTVLIVGAIAFVEDLASVLVLWKSMKGNLNVKAAAIHLIGDTLATVGVLISGALILWQGITWVDPAVTLAIAAYIVVHATIEMREVIGLLMERSPEDLDVADVREAAEGVEGVQALRHVHAWRARRRPDGAGGVRGRPWRDERRRGRGRQRSTSRRAPQAIRHRPRHVRDGPLRHRRERQNSSPTSSSLAHPPHAANDLPRQKDGLLRRRADGPDAPRRRGRRRASRRWPAGFFPSGGHDAAKGSGLRRGDIGRLLGGIVGRTAGCPPAAGAARLSGTATQRTIRLPGRPPGPARRATRPWGRRRTTSPFCNLIPDNGERLHP